MADSAVLVLENGSVFQGQMVGAAGVSRGVMVGYTGMSGFHEVMTDPSYRGKMLCFTYPHVGNPGVNPDDLQSGCIQAAGVAMRECSRIKANRLGQLTFNDFLAQNRIPGIEGIDTRKITRMVAEKGPMAAIIGAGAGVDADALLRTLRDEPAAPPCAGEAQFKSARIPSPEGSPAFKVVVYDFGAKTGFLRRLAGMGCAPVVVAPDSTPDAALAGDVAGVVFSAGPGDPAACQKAVETAKVVLGKKPVWGVGVGAGVVARAAGAETYTDGRGHYGCQGVGRTGTRLGEMTMQCHDFWIDGESLAKAGMEATHFHLNDLSVEGFASATLRVMGTLFHPESEPGPRDSLYLFDRFVEQLLSQK